MSGRSAGAPPVGPFHGESGATMVELLLALPVVLLLGLGIAQFMLVYQAKHALDYALTQAARQGAVSHASGDSIRDGLAVGLVPYLYGAGDWNQLLLAEARATEHVEQGLSAGWIRLRQRAPTLESFADWAEPALDPMGDPIPGVVEIANDNLDSRRLRMQPLSGIAGERLSEPIGQLSGQTLADANLLRLELIYGVRLVVPVVGILLVRTLSIWNGCSAPTSPDRLGLLTLGSVDRLASASSWMCAFLTAPDGDGRPNARIPLRASATVRMMSTARRSELAQARVDAGSGMSSAATGSPEPGAGGSPAEDSREDGTGFPARSRGDGNGDGDGGIGAADRRPLSRGTSLENGFLQIGSDRPYRTAASHPALCPG